MDPQVFIYLYALVEIPTVMYMASDPPVVSSIISVGLFHIRRSWQLNLFRRAKR
jgi:hypothetical protein